MYDEQDSDDKPYKSPTKKLLKFFEKSRNGWKTKCQEAEYKVKLLQNKVRYLEKRNARLKNRVKELERELSRQGVKKSLDH